MQIFLEPREAVPLTIASFIQLSPDKSLKTFAKL